MKLSWTPTTLAAIAGLLLLGPSVHAQTTPPSTNSTPPTARRAGGPVAVDAQLSRLSAQLKLTDEQKPKVKGVLAVQIKQMQELRADTSLSQEDRRAKMLAIRNEVNAKMKGILTPDQYKEFEQMHGRGGHHPGAGNAGEGAAGQ